MVRIREQPRGEVAGAGAEPLGGGGGGWEGLAERLWRGDRGVDGRVGVAAARECGGCGEEERGAAAAAEEHSGRIAGWLGVPHTRETQAEAAEQEELRRGRREASAGAWTWRSERKWTFFLRAVAARGCA